MTLAELSEASGRATAPSIVSPLPLQPGGVDPLGMRQRNFDLMDMALPGINNAANRLRPYVVLTWAWWKAGELARATGQQNPDATQLKAYVDRIEVAFAVSHLRAAEFDGLLGSQVLERYLDDGHAISFSGDRWKSFRESRAPTTSLMAPVAYGPSIKTGSGLGFLDPAGRVALAPVDAVMPAVMAFDACLAPVLSHPLFTSLDDLVVSVAEVSTWHPLWRVADVTPAEQEVGRQRLYEGDTGRGLRKGTLRLVEQVLARADAPLDVSSIRTALTLRTVAETPSDLIGSTGAVWRALQARQLFRLCLEGLLVWVLETIGQRAMSLDDLAIALLEATGEQPLNPFENWLHRLPARADGLDPTTDPVLLQSTILANGRQADWPGALLDGIRVSLAIAAEANPSDPLYQGQRDRLPLNAALVRAQGMAAFSLEEALGVILAEWVVGQHVYWAVGRSGDETQRLRLMLDEGGWTAIMTRPSFPTPTPDRLATALNLMADCGVISRSGEGLFRGC